MSTFDELAVLEVGLAVRHELPQAIYDFAVFDHFSCVRLRFVPNMLRNALHELQVAKISVEAATWILLFGLLGQLPDSALMV